MAKRTTSIVAKRTVSSERTELNDTARQWGNLLRSIRSATDDPGNPGNKYTQETFAAHLGVPQSTVSRWECGERMPRDAKRQLIAAALNINPDVLFSLPAKQRRAS